MSEKTFAAEQKCTKNLKSLLLHKQGSFVEFISFRTETGQLRTRKKNDKPGEGFVKICRVKNARVGEGWELQRALDDAFGIQPGGNGTIMLRKSI